MSWSLLGALNQTSGLSLMFWTRGGHATQASRPSRCRQRTPAALGPPSVAAAIRSAPASFHPTKAASRWRSRQSAPARPNRRHRRQRANPGYGFGPKPASDPHRRRRRRNRVVCRDGECSMSCRRLRRRLPPRRTGLTARSGLCRCRSPHPRRSLPASRPLAASLDRTPAGRGGAGLRHRQPIR